MPESVYAKIQAGISESLPNETGGFLLAHPAVRRVSRALVVKECLDYDGEKWNEQETAFLEPKTSYISDSAIVADKQSATLVFYHSHPASGRRVSFSSIDVKGNRKLLPNLSDLLSQRPTGSIVFSKQGFDGVVLERGKWGSIRQLSIVGQRLASQTNVKDGAPVSDEQFFDRQVGAFGNSSQQTLGRLKIAIVGAGGIGSALSVQLSKLGVGELVIIDHDKVEKSNLPRLYGAKKSDVGKPKSSVLAKHLSSVGFSRKVKHLESSVIEGWTLDLLLEADVVMCCTDNQRSRSFLNDFAYQYCIPVIDSGCRVTNGPEPQSALRVQVLVPGRACLWCTGVLDGRTLVQETLSDAEIERLRAEGYAAPKNQPGLITLTTATASFAVLRLLNLTTSYGPDCPTRTLFELLSGALVIDEPTVQPKCVCQTRACLADTRRLPT